jgi:hypothetical protein
MSGRQWEFVSFGDLEFWKVQQHHHLFLFIDEGASGSVGEYASS